MTIPETEVSAQEIHRLKFTKYGIAFANDYEKTIKGKTLQLSLIKNYETTPSGSILYSSDNPSVATVSSTGAVKAVSKGSAVITATHGSYEATCRIYVTDESSVLKSGKCGKNLSYTLSSDGTLTFTGSGEMTSAPWVEYNRFIKKIDFPKNIKNIYKGAFLESTSLKALSIPSTIKTIEQNSFNGCTSLESITLANGVESIGEHAFCNTKISSISIPKSVKEIGYRAFEGCSYLKKITCNSSCDSIYNGFSNSSTMKNVEVIYGIAGTDANDLADKFQIDFIPLSNKNFTVSVDSSKIIINKYIGESGTVTVPSKIDGIDVSDIKTDCFTGKTKITSVSIPDSISSNVLFKKCKNLKNIKLSGNMTIIPNGMFLGCSSLKNIVLPENITEIGDNAFDSCISLTTISLPNKVQNIGEYAFYNCKKLRSINIPESLSYLEGYAFLDCDQLKCLIIPAKLETFSVYGLINKGFTTIYGNSDTIKNACGDFSFLSNISYFTIPDNKTTFTDNGVTVTGYLPPNTTMEVSKSNYDYSIHFINNGKEIEPCGEINVSVLNNEKNKFVVELYPDNEEQFVKSSYESGKYTFKTQAKSFKFTDALKGDTNGDGEVNIADALMISRYDAGLTTLDESMLDVSDVNGDGEVNIADALMIARLDAGLTDSL